MRLILASASPARLKLLRAAGVQPEVVVSGVHEDGVSGTPEEVALTLAQRKARAVANAQGPHGAEENAVAQASLGTQRPNSVLVLGCDSVLDLDGAALGKPVDAADAIERWRRMSGRNGILRTGHWLIDLGSGQEVGAVAATTVRFARPSADEVAAYVATGEPQRVAGAFTIDGIGAWFIDSVDGDPGTVIGLSLPLLRNLVNRLGYQVSDLWA